MVVCFKIPYSTFIQLVDIGQFECLLKPYLLIVPQRMHVTMVWELLFCLILIRHVLPGRRIERHFRQISLLHWRGSLTLCLVASFKAISTYLLARARSSGAFSRARRMSSSILCVAKSLTSGFAGMAVHDLLGLFG